MSRCLKAYGIVLLAWMLAVPVLNAQTEGSSKPAITNNNAEPGQASPNELTHASKEAGNQEEDPT